MRVLIVEDEVLIRMLVTDLLEEAGHTCVEAADAMEALALLKDEAFQPDVLVSDFNLGVGPSGQALAREAARIIPGLRTVFVTGNPEAFDDYPFREGERLIAKPFAGADLVRLLHELRPGPAQPVATGVAPSPAWQLQAA